MNEGDVVLSALSQADGLIKNRPCVALRLLARLGAHLTPRAN